MVDTIDPVQLFEAAGKGDINTVKFILDRGIPVNSLVNGESPLFTATLKGHTRVVEFLLSRDCDVNLGNVDRGLSPLHVAPTPMIALALIGGGAVTTISSKDPDGDLPLHKAVRNGSDGVVATLIDGGMDVNCTNSEQDTPLHCAAAEGMKKLCLELIQMWGADPTMKNIHGKTPYDMAVGHRQTQQAIQECMLMQFAIDGDIDNVKNLLENGNANVDAVVDHVSPLYAASTNGNDKLVAVLLHHHADVDFRSNDGRTALHVASTKRVCDLLITHGANVGARDFKRRHTPLHEASRLGLLEVARSLVDRGADVHAHNAKGQIPVDLAANNDIRKYLTQQTGKKLSDRDEMLRNLRCKMQSDRDMMESKLREEIFRLREELTSQRREMARVQDEHERELEAMSDLRERLVDVQMQAADDVMTNVDEARQVRKEKELLEEKVSMLEKEVELAHMAEQIAKDRSREDRRSLDVEINERLRLQALTQSFERLQDAFWSEQRRFEEALVEAKTHVPQQQPQARHESIWTRAGRKSLFAMRLTPGGRNASPSVTAREVARAQEMASSNMASPSNPVRPSSTTPTSHERKTSIAPVSTQALQAWQPNEDVSVCPICKKWFTVFRRKHHCRSCRRVVCGPCSPDRMTLGADEDGVRVCRHCASAVRRNTKEFDLTTPAKELVVGVDGGATPRQPNLSKSLKPPSGTKALGEKSAKESPRSVTFASEAHVSVFSSQTIVEDSEGEQARRASMMSDSSVDGVSSVMLVGSSTPPKPMSAPSAPSPATPDLRTADGLDRTPPSASVLSASPSSAPRYPPGQLPPAHLMRVFMPTRFLPPHMTENTSESTSNQ